MKTLEVQQGSEQWHQARAKHFTASEAPIMMGASKYQTRSALLNQKHTGVTPEVDAATQRRFDAGHAAEAAARPLVEDEIGQELFQITGTLQVEGLPLLASFDGVTMLGDEIWESKLWNDSLVEQVRGGQLEPHYYWQLEQQLLVSGARRAYFTASDGTKERTVGMWYESVPERRAQIIAGWKQFKSDLDAYQHVEAEPAPVAAVPDALPALTVQVEGRVLTTNLDQFALTAKNFIANIKTELSTDQDFADADKMTKFLKDGEDKLELVKEQTLAQTASIDELFRTIDSLREEMRAKRLTLGKLVENRKVSIRAEIQESGNKAVREHLDALNKRLGKPYMPDKKWSDFATAMRGKKTITSLRSAVNDEIARFKIESNEIADRIQMNLSSLRELATDYAFLFADTAQIVLKANDDLVALVKLRIADHKDAEARKAEQARIKKEQEDARLAEALKVAKPIEPTSTPVGVSVGGEWPAMAPSVPSPPLPAATPLTVSAQASTARPTDDQIIDALAMNFHAHESTVIGWLLDMDLHDASERMTQEFKAEGSRK